MTLRKVHLRKLLKIIYLADGPRKSALRKEIREDRDRALKAGGKGGGDFYVPFWRDAKQHVFSIQDLHNATDTRIRRDSHRQNLYPKLRDGFLLWWNEKRRWTNAPFVPGQQLRALFHFPRLDAVIKVENILSARDERGDEHYVYPYFAENPILDEEAARLGLWVLGQALPAAPHEEIRILDVIRGETFSIDRYPLLGNEEIKLRDRFAAVIEEWEGLQKEYKGLS